MSADAWCWPATYREVERVLRRHRPSIVLSEYVLFSKCLEAVPVGTLRMIDTHEVFFRNQDRFQLPGLRAPRVCSPESEKAALARSDVLIAIQSHDAAALRGASPDKRVITVGHACQPAPPRSQKPDRGVVLYVGSQNPFNVHGLADFLTHAWRRILSDFPEAKLEVVGSCTPPEGHPGVRYRGLVGDRELAELYRGAHIVINPQVAGTGLKIKSVEAVNAGCPVVMNAAGAEGLEEGAGSAFLLAADWDDFAQAAVKLLRDDVYRTSIEEEARHFARRTFSPESVFTELAEILK